MAWVPGGKVMAKVIGVPAALAASASGLITLGSAATLPLYLACMVMAWPLRLSIQGMIIGFFGAPSRPIVEAIGMPVSMCVAWMSPFESESRMAAQLAPLITVLLMPYFLNSPFSCAITIGEQSVSAIMPKRRSGISGALLLATEDAAAGALDGGVAAAAVPELSDLHAPSVAAAPRPTAPCRKLRRPSLEDLMVMRIL